MSLRRCVPLPAARRRRDGTRAAAAIAVLVLAAACSSPSPSPSPSGTPQPSPSPTPTPLPTATFTNEPDAELSGLIPAQVGDRTVEQPPVDQYALTPGDIGQAAYGELGDRFRSLVIAFVRSPRLSLYAMRVDPPVVTTPDLEPHLATAGRYVGIAGLQRDPWQLADVAGHWVWVRPSDNATLPGTKVYTWATDDLVFLLIGVDDAQNQALIALLPGDPAPTPTPEPSTSPSASGGGEASPSPSGS